MYSSAIASVTYAILRHVLKQGKTVCYTFLVFDLVCVTCMHALTKLVKTLATHFEPSRFARKNEVVSLYKVFGGAVGQLNQPLVVMLIF